MTVYSTCRTCKTTLIATVDAHGTYSTVHPGCEPVETKTERLAKRWRDAVMTEDTATESDLQKQIDELDQRPPRLIDAATTYAKWGWHVFPLKAQTKRPATRRGFKDATTDVTRIAAWWTRHPDHNIGLSTGHTFDVIDVDVPSGVQSYQQLMIDGKIPDIHGQVATSSGGLHLYVKTSGDGNSAGFIPGIDYRGDGGYVVAPPSTLGQSHRTWSWITPPSPAIKTSDVDG